MGVQEDFGIHKMRNIKLFEKSRKRNVALLNVRHRAGFHVLSTHPPVTFLQVVYEYPVTQRTRQRLRKIK